MASVSHVDQEQLDRRMATTPQDVLFGVPGVAMQSDANRTASSVNIRGLQDFGRVAVIVDGARQNFQRSGHGTQSMFWLDPELVQQVDVIRGPVANTYGSGAIGGVVVFETKDADDFLREGETWAGSATGRYDTNGEGWTTSGTGAYRFSDSFDVLGNIVWRDFDDYTDGNGDEVAGTSFDVLSGLLKSTIRPTENSELKLGWIGASDSWTEGGNTSELETKQNTFTGRYNVKDDDESWLDLHVNVAYNKTDLDQTYLTDVTAIRLGNRPSDRRPGRLANHIRHRNSELRPLEHLALRHRRSGARTDLWRRLGPGRCRHKPARPAAATSTRRRASDASPAPTSRKS